MDGAAATPVRHPAVVATPTRTQSLRSRTPSRVDATPSRRERALEVGDAVSFEGTDLTGVLRYLGPVHGRDGVFAGLELTGLSYGQGKNDGTIQGVQYFATEPNNGVFGPAAKLIALPSLRPTSATARPLSSLSGRHSRADGRERDAPPTPSSERPRRRQSGVPMPSSTPRATPRRSLGGSAMRAARAPPAWATPQVPRRAPTPGRPGSSAAPRRPASAARVLPRHEDPRGWDDAAPLSREAHQDLLEQLALPPSVSSGNVDEAGVPTTEYERLCDELADVRRQLTDWERERSEMRQAAQQREQEWEEIKRLELEDEGRRRLALERQTAELQRQLNEALDTATVAAEVHDALERQSTQHAERIAELEAALAAVQIRAEHAAQPRDAETDDPQALTLLQAKVEQMMAAWARERTDLTDRIATLQTRADRTSALERELSEVQRASQDVSGPSAADIDNASLKEQLAHLQSKADTLEAELAEAKAALEQATEAKAQAQAAWAERTHAESEQLRTDAAQWEARARDAEAQAQALRTERDECRATLERERAEAEALRDSPHTPHLGTGVPASPGGVDLEVVRSLEARIAQLEREKAEEHAHFTKEMAELESLVESRIFREDELETELERLRAAAAS
ncbi:hypothetical protein MCAP1_000831 [Malassezia caprae]|uniref:CAP-Gly domain-containing protein n=1 Tax=Malassezia caprae TaxID=1381934 RepID=A0AAF0IZ29_9BASI|nr:hypothetical protein MCAP1_000831 [Malassezia caprae]